jgi:putative endonuclease
LNARLLFNLYSGYAWRSRARAEGRSVPGVALLGEDGLEAQMWYVYIIRSINNPEQEYTGATADLKRRLSDHNAGKSAHTAKFKPWQLVWYCAFPDKYKALAFEKYLKSHSGRAFAKKHL